MSKKLPSPLSTVYQKLRHYRPAVIAAGRGSNTTMFGCGSAKGQTIPPYIVFKGARITAEMREGLTQGTVL